jgi:hypothetical protein
MPNGVALVCADPDEHNMHEEMIMPAAAEVIGGASTGVYPGGRRQRRYLV